MANFTITIPDAIVSRVVDGLAGQHGYQATTTDEDTGVVTPNPETKQDFARRMMRKWIKESVVAYETGLTEAARKAAEAKAELEIDI